MTVASEGMPLLPGARGFAPFKKSDRNFFLLMLALIWLGILMGFVPDMMRHFHSKEAPYTTYTPYHSIVFSAWLVLLTTQVLLARSGAVSVHRKLGLIAWGLVPLIVVIGTLTAFAAGRRDLGTADADPSFLFPQIASLITFLALAGAALLLRRTPVAHKRLMFLGTFTLSDAGFVRWLGGPLFKALGHGFWPALIAIHFGSIVLLLLFGIYDLITRKRLHPAFVIGAIWIVAVQMVATYLYISPVGTSMATGLIRSFG